MKKLFLSALFVIGLTTISHAQSKGKVELGVGLGFSTYSVSSDNLNSSSGNGVNFGGSAEYYFSDRWGIKAKLIYDSKGWDDGFISEGPDDPIYETDFKLKYLTIPVMANWHFGKKRNWYLNFGPYLGILMSAKDTTLDMDLKDGFNSTDFGLAYGIGVKIPVSKELKFFIEFDGQGGLTNIFAQSDETVTTNRGAFNVGLNFLLK